MDHSVQAVGTAPSGAPAEPAGRPVSGREVLFFQLLDANLGAMAASLETPAAGPSPGPVTPPAGGGESLPGGGQGLPLASLSLPLAWNVAGASRPDARPVEAAGGAPVLPPGELTVAGGEARSGEPESTELLLLPELLPGAGEVQPRAPDVASTAARLPAVGPAVVDPGFVRPASTEATQLRSAAVNPPAAGTDPVGQLVMTADGPEPPPAAVAGPGPMSPPAQAHRAGGGFAATALADPAATQGGLLSGIAALDVDGDGADFQLDPARPTTTANPTGAAPLARMAVPFGDARWSESVGQRLTWMAGQGVGKAEIQLDPPELGRLNVEIEIRGDSAQVQFQSDQAAVRDTLESALPRLREMMAQAGFSDLEFGVGQQSAGEQDGETGARTAGGEADGDPVADAMPAGSGAVSGDGLVDLFA